MRARGLSRSLRRASLSAAAASESGSSAAATRNAAAQLARRQPGGLRRHASTAAAATQEEKFDYVILGAGSAGCVLASRLTEDADVRVCLLEAGPSDTGSWDSWKIRMPSALTFNLNGTKYNWDFWTTPQKHLDGRRIHQPRGKMLGGSSGLNAMAYIRGHALDYERWGNEGATGWSYASCLPYFKKAQRHMDGESEYCGGRGPLGVTTGWYENELNDAFVKSGVEAGYAHTPDLNGFRQEGVGPMHMTVREDGVRASTSNCYLHTPVDGAPDQSVRTRRSPHATRFPKALLSQIACVYRTTTSHRSNAQTWRSVPAARSRVSSSRTARAATAATSAVSAWSTWTRTAQHRSCGRSGR